MDNLLQPTSSTDRILAELSPYSLINSLPDSLILLNLEGQVIFINQKFTELTGYLPAEILGLSHYDLVRILVAKNTVDYSTVWQAFQQALQGKPFYAKRKYYHKSGHTIPVEISESLVLNQYGEPSGILLVINDRHSEFMLKITRLVNSSLDLNQVLQNVTRVVVEHLDLSSNAIFLFNPEDQRLHLVSCNVFPEEALDKIVIPLGEGAPGIIAETRHPLYISNLQEDPRIPEVGRAIHSAKSSIGFPLVCRDELLGVIAFDAEIVREFSAREIRTFENIAGQVSLVIYNSRLLTQFEHLSITDGLTGAYNHRYFQVKLAESFQFAQQNSIPLSLLFIDLDHFKNFNDTFGHPRGDDLLKQLTEVLKENVRPLDPVCRYGGEEFAIILHGCSIAEATQIAERIRLACEKLITISIGIAGYPQITSCQELLVKADQALYQAKLFRNHVQCFIA